LSKVHVISAISFLPPLTETSLSHHHILSWNPENQPERTTKSNTILYKLANYRDQSFAN